MDRISTSPSNTSKPTSSRRPNPRCTREPVFLDRFAGYYHDASPRNQVIGFIDLAALGPDRSPSRRRARIAILYLDRRRPLVPGRRRILSARIRSRCDASLRDRRRRTDGADRRRSMRFAHFALAGRERSSAGPDRLSVLVSPLLVIFIWMAHATRATPERILDAEGDAAPASLAHSFHRPSPLTTRGRNLGQLNPWTATIYGGLSCCRSAGVVATGSHARRMARAARAVAARLRARRLCLGDCRVGVSLLLGNGGI